MMITNLQVAVKKVDVRGSDKRQRELVKSITKEFKALRKLIGSAGIVKVYGHAETPQGDQILVLEYMGGGDLSHLLYGEGVDRSALDPLRRQCLVNQVAQAVAVIHKMGFMHRDLKPDNCFLNTEQTAVKVRRLSSFVSPLLT
jgi:serine/threonine protein kinase